ncbi:MAG: polysaccharide pyruvyl transferase family protein [Colwellia sp.]|uniref:polysaccharide pyruvyl transferase family protein n=1 Tax=Colwellia sp. TaxID=56799 RepID=UPI0025BF285D|nr:polysaccharide pyruvyl transferase family protein [Colwellia sp.]NQZ25365.1 polysaccharide pyruvyl transferase family protein [Colwellia sp.]
MTINILLTDNVILNGGDSAILKGTFDVLNTLPKSNGFSYKVHCDYFDSAINQYKDLPLNRSIQESVNLFPPRFFWRFSSINRFVKYGPLTLSKAELEAFNDYKQADIVITCGGSFLTDSYSLENTLLGYDVALNLKKPLYLVGQSIGPFTSEIKKEEVAIRLRKMDKILVRDHKSYLEALDMGCSVDSLYEAKDMAFNISTKVTNKTLDEDNLTIGISVRKWTFPYDSQLDRDKKYENYISSMRELVNSLVDKYNANIVFVSTCQGDESYKFHDNKVAEEITAGLSRDTKERVTINSTFMTPEVFMSEVEKLDVFIGTRMHACILALLKNIPTINICYEFKSAELFESMDLGNFVHDINQVEPIKIIENISLIFSQYDEIKSNIFMKIAEFKEINRKAIHEVFE